MSAGMVERLLDGAVDLHVHPAPSPYPRRIGPVGAARHAGEAGMRALALKSHHHCTAMDVAAVAAEGLDTAGVTLVGGIVLNSQVGGFNPQAVGLSLAMGGRIVWLPTISSPAHIAQLSGGAVKFPKSTLALPPERPIDALSEDGTVREDVREVLRLVAEADAILASGHLPAASVVAVFELAHELGVRRLLVNHPNFIVNASVADVRRLLELGAYVEHATCMYDEASRLRSFELPVLVEWIKAIGCERSTLASDLGQADNPLPAESFAAILRALHAEGFSERELRSMINENPGGLLGLDPA